MDTPEPRIAVIVPSHLARRTIGACLDGLAEQTLHPGEFEVHVVDSGADDTAEVVRERAVAWGDRLHLHEVSPELGPGAKRNAGASATRATRLAFTDADCVPSPRWLERIVAALDEAEIAQGSTVPPPGAGRGPFDHAIEVTEPSALFESCNIAYRRSAFDQAGGFPEGAFEMSGDVFGEDAELAWRAIRAGARTRFCTDAIVHHDVIKVPFRYHLGTQWRARHFPGLVKRVPELRRELLIARLFLGRRSVTFDGLIAGLAAAPWFPPALVLVLPYAVLLVGAVGVRSPRAVARAGRRLTSDAVRFAALAWGSARCGSPVL